MTETILRSGDVERAMNAIGYSHGRHEDQANRARDFGKIVKGVNLITPRRAGLYRLKAKPYVIVEISLGDPIFRGDGSLIGCTVADCATGENLYDKSRAVHSLDEMQDFMRELERDFS